MQIVELGWGKGGGCGKHNCINRFQTIETTLYQTHEENIYIYIYIYIDEPLSPKYPLLFRSYTDLEIFDKLKQTKMKDKSISISTSAFFSFFPLFILLLRASMKQKTSKDHNSQMVSSLDQPLLHTKYVSSSSCFLNHVVCLSLFLRLFPYCCHKLKEQLLKMVRVSATGLFSLAFKVCKVFFSLQSLELVYHTQK